MKVGTWKKFVQAGVLAVSLAVLPIATPIGAQQRDTAPPMETRSVDTQDENTFPWGLLGLLGLLGLTGLKRRPDVVERRHVNEPARRGV
jgi:MYXO-CTERM domain-containing protein